LTYLVKWEGLMPSGEIRGTKRGDHDCGKGEGVVQNEQLCPKEGRGLLNLRIDGFKGGERGGKEKVGSLS